MTDNINKNALLPGYRLHWYEIESILGQGGFGITYLATDKNLQRKVAIKEYLPVDFAQRGENDWVAATTEENKPIYQWGLERFIDEARTLSKFEHSNIVKVHAVFEENGTGYMVMSYEHGKSLQEILKEPVALDEQALLNIVLPLLAGLELVHEHNFIHRDIKPDNIFIRDDGSPVLLDFGSARQSLSGESKALTVLVTPGYAPVEQYYSNSDEQGPWTDIYGLGATLYKVVTGRALTNAVDRSKLALKNEVDEKTSALLLAKENYSSQFLRAIDRAVEFKPEDRPQSVAEWRDFLINNSDSEKTRVIPAAKTRQNRQSTNVSSSELEKRPLSFTAKISVAGLLLVVVCLSIYFYLDKDSVLKSPMAVEPNKTEPQQDLVSVTSPEVSEAGNTNRENKEENIERKENDLVEPPKKEASLELEDKLKRQKMDEELEAQRLALDQQRQQLAEEKKKMEAAKLAQHKTEKLVLQKKIEAERLQKIENKILASQPEFKTRSAVKADKLPFIELDVVKDLNTIPNKQLELGVKANIEGWQSSGIAISRGKTYKLAAQGVWRMGPLCNATGPDGEGVYALLCINVGNQIVANYSHSALIGKIGKGSLAFYVGEGFEFTADRDGVLYFMSNDAVGFFGDNSESLQVAVSLVDE